MAATSRLGPARACTALLVCLAALALTGCRLGVGAEALVEADGSGAAVVVVTLDPALLDALDAAGVDPTAELEAAVAATDGWAVERTIADDGTLTVTVRHEVADATTIGDTFRELSAGLDEQDPALLVDIEVGVDEPGAAQVRGTAALRAPSTAGAIRDGEPVGPDEQELAELVTSSVDAELVVTLPGRIVHHDGDSADERSVRWALTQDPRSIDAASQPPSWWQQIPIEAAVVAGAALLVVVLGVVVWLVVRRRRRTPAATDASSTPAAG